MGTQTNSPWKIDTKSDLEVSKTLADEEAKKIYKKAKGSVSQDPVTNRKSKHLKGGRYTGMYRWKNPPFRLIYGVQKDTKTVFPAIFDRRGHIDY